MRWHSQNREAEIVAGYFGDRKGCVLDIGSNDGMTFSNSRDLILNGWQAFLVEPSPKAYAKLSELYDESGLPVVLVNYAITEETGEFEFFDSGAHVYGGNDVALVSGLQIQSKWRHCDYEKVSVDGMPFNCFYGLVLLSYARPLQWNRKFNFITIDAEGWDWKILQQIDLKEVGCECLCIEHNGSHALAERYTEHCRKFGLKEIHRNAENIIFAL